jgi:hypothetical protein
MRPIFLALLFASPTLCAQTQSEVDTLVAETIPHQQQMDLQARAFTRFELIRDRNYDEKGKLFVDNNNTFETVFIADLPYLRWTAKDGKPLSSKDAAKEQKRYDDAVRSRTGLSMQQKASVMKKRVIKTDLSLKAVPLEYTHQLLRHERVDAHDTWVILCKPKDSSVHPVTFTLFIDPSRSFVERLTFRYDKDAGETLAGSYGSHDYFEQDGAALDRSAEAHFRVLQSGKLITGESDHTWSNYHRFLASARIVDMKEVPDADPVRQ